MTKRHFLALALWSAAGLAPGCQPYESKTAELGERGIQPVLTAEELSEKRAPTRSSTPWVVPGSTMRSRNDLRQRRGMEDVDVPDDWPPPRDSRPTINWPQESQRPGPVRSAEFEECVGRYELAKRKLDRYGREAPKYIMVQDRVGRPPRKMSCSQIRFYMRMGGDRERVYGQYAVRCTTMPASGPLYEEAKAEADRTKAECHAIARRAGILPGVARSRLR